MATLSSRLLLVFKTVLGLTLLFQGQMLLDVTQSELESDHGDTFCSCCSCFMEYSDFSMRSAQILEHFKVLLTTDRHSLQLKRSLTNPFIFCAFIISVILPICLYSFLFLEIYSKCYLYDKVLYGLCFKGRWQRCLQNNSSYLCIKMFYAFWKR